MATIKATIKAKIKATIKTNIVILNKGIRHDQQMIKIISNVKILLSPESKFKIGFR